MRFIGPDRTWAVNLSGGGRRRVSPWASAELCRGASRDRRSTERWTLSSATPATQGSGRERGRCGLRRKDVHNEDVVGAGSVLYRRGCGGPATASTSRGQDGCAAARQSLGQRGEGAPGDAPQD